MNVLSLFDGISCGQLALQRANVHYDAYYASEIHDPSIRVTMKHFPATIQLGDVNDIDFSKLPHIHLLIGGSPCQDISNLNKDKISGINGDKSKLFYRFLEAKEYFKDAYFMLENVDGNKASVRKISKLLGVRPLRLNSNLVSAQNRHRLYWTNIKVMDVPKNKRLLLPSILENEVDVKYYQSQS